GVRGPGVDRRDLVDRDGKHPPARPAPYARQDRRHVLDDALLGLRQPRPDDDGPHSPAWEQPRCEEILDVEPNGTEGERRQRAQDRLSRNFGADRKRERGFPTRFPSLSMLPAPCGMRMRRLPPISQRPIARNRRLSSSIPARPYICRFNSFNLLMQPSTRPLLHGYVSAFITASMSCSRLLAKPLRGASEDRAAWSSHALSASALRSVRILRNSCRREYAARADGDASRTMSRKRRSFSSSFSGGQVNHRRSRLGPRRKRR